MKLAVFLGNPGEKYKQTRHNAGWLMAEYLREQWAMSAFAEKKKFAGSVSESLQQGVRILFLLPDTFMNLSGRSVRAVTQFYKIDPHDILLVYDDKDLPIGVVRFREKGSAGGHNGVKSIIAELGTDAIGRIKIGVDSELRTDHSLGTADFVLSDFNADERKQLQETVFPLAENKILSWLRHDENEPFQGIEE